MNGNTFRESTPPPPLILILASLPVGDQPIEERTNITLEGGQNNGNLTLVRKEKENLFSVLYIFDHFS